jgi:3-oxoacyl-(acyl-carrier-protein) synthase
MNERIVVTGMSVNTPLGDDLGQFLDGLLSGRSAITQWRAFDTGRIYSKVGGDLSGYDVAARLKQLSERMPAEWHKRLRKLVSRSPWSTGLTMLMTMDAWLDSGLVASEPEMTRVAAIVGGHNINANYQYQNRLQFAEEPDYMDSMLALCGLDTDHAGCISEMLGARGPIYTVGAACASANTAMRCAVDEIRHHDAEVAVVTGAVLDFSPLELHAMALMGAISFQSFNDCPSRASRPYDLRREGFVPSHGGACLILETAEHALRRKARIYAEVLGVEANADGNHLPQPSEEGQARLMKRLLDKLRIDPGRVDYISAHATSTLLGDRTEIQSIKRVYGTHARKLKINAPKSILGHTCWAAPIVETVAGILQMNAGKLHPSVNIDEMDPEVDLDVCVDGPVEYPVHCFMKNSFGFGGINCVSLLSRFEERTVLQ